MNSTESQVPIEKRAAEPDNMEVVDAVDNETSPDLIFSDGFYGDLINLSAEELSPASSWGSFDDYLVIVNDIELDELDQHLPWSSTTWSSMSWISILQAPWRAHESKKYADAKRSSHCYL